MREAILLLALASANSGIALRVVEPMLPALAEEFAVSAPRAALIISAYGLSYSFAQLVWGPMGDRFGKLRVVTLSLFFASASSIGCAFARDLGTLAMLRFGTGLFASTVFLLGMAYIGDRVPLAERQPVIARYAAGTITGQAIGPFVGGALTDLIGWRGALAVIGVIFGAVAVLLLVRSRAQWSEDPGRPFGANPFAVHQKLLRLPRVRRILGVSAFETFCFFGAFSFLGVYLKLRFELSLTLIGAVLAGFGAGGILYTLMVKRLLARMGQRGLVLWGGTGCLACYGLAVMAPSWGWVAVATVGLGYFFYMIHNVLQTKASEMAPQARGTGLSMYSSCWATGQAAGAAAVGLAVQFAGYEASLLACGLGLAALGIWLRTRLDRI